MRRFLSFLFVAAVSILASMQELCAQDSIPALAMPQDTVAVISEARKFVERGNKISIDPQKRSSTKALLYSIVPGGGQIYNRQYWKLPIIIGAYTACYYAISWNHNNLMEYANAYRDIKSDRPLENTSWVDFIPYGANKESYVNNSTFHETLKRGRDYYRRYRDLSIIITAGVYILVMVDAYVDAELSNFDISPNLTLSYAPTYIPPALGSDPRHGGVGMLLALTF